jgi:PAS domain S-box-containing protein
MQQGAGFMPHGMCLAWRPDLLALHVGSDAAIAAAYFAIPLSLAWFVRRRTDLEPSHRAIALLFVVFITLCGLTHVASIIVLWTPLYVAEGWLKTVTAIASIATAGFLPFLVPKLLKIPSPKALQAEVEAHRSTLDELGAARVALARQVSDTEGELRATTRRFEAALRNSPITVLEQDEALRYTWAYNPPLGLTAAEMVGRTEADFFAEESLKDVQALKRSAMDSAQPRRAEVRIEVGGREGWFDLRVEPVEIADGRRGLIATSTDVTARRRNEAHLRMLMREMNHRAKNILAMVAGIVRQTARAFDVPPGFDERLGERLASLASAHDVLASQNWRGADLREVLVGQLRHQLDAYGDRITVEGPDVILPAEAAHYVGLALHELGSNAVKHGALAQDDGRVAVRWTITPAEGGQVLDLEWREANPAIQAGAPGRAGFGSTILKSLVARALGGRSEMAFEPEGFVWRLHAVLPPPEAAPPADLSVEVG